MGRGFATANPYRRGPVPGFLLPSTLNRDSGEALADGAGGGFGAIVDFELGEEVGDVRLGRAEADVEGVGDLAVALALDEQPQYLLFAWRQVVGIGGGVAFERSYGLDQRREEGGGFGQGLL